MIVIKFLGGVLLAAAAISAVWTVKGLLLSPVRPQKGTDLFTVVYVTGTGEGLEHTVKGLMWLRNSGRIRQPVMIVCQTENEDTLKRASSLADMCGGIMCAPGDILRTAEESGWIRPDIHI